MNDDEHKLPAIRPEVLGFAPGFTPGHMQVYRDNAGDLHDGRAPDEFVLGVGAPYEKTLHWPEPWPHDRLIGQWFDHTADQLRRLRTHFADPRGGRNQNVCLVDGIWLVWCYAATDIKNLYLQLAEQSDQIAELRSTIRELRSTLNDLSRLTVTIDRRLTNLDGEAP